MSDDVSLIFHQEDDGSWSILCNGRGDDMCRCIAMGFADEDAIKQWLRHCTRGGLLVALELLCAYDAPKQ
jgi:hypothetical protein